MAKAKEKNTNREKSVPQTANLVGKPIYARGRIFEGTVTKKFPTRVVIEFERTLYIKKYERFAKKKTRIHAHLPSILHDSVNVGDFVRVQECRPLSKLIHSVVLEKLRSSKSEAKK